MYVLGIETSCDETAAAVVKDGRIILSNVITSSERFHKVYGGIIPEVAFRMQLETISAVVNSALKEAQLKLKQINLLSVTNGPGLIGSLLVGISFAKAVALSENIPLLGLNHLHSHLYASFLGRKDTAKLPFIALVVSGGHTSLFYVQDFQKIKLLGSTHDDACGEAFDKVAKILGLGYPGGPVIEGLSKKGNPKKVKFNCSDTKNPLDFSFSGIKTAVLYYLKERAKDNGRIADIAASFQEAVIDSLIKKSLLACRLKKINRLVLGGGVVANNRLREKLGQAASDHGIQCFFPPLELCMDNAAMVAGLAYRLFKKGCSVNLDLNIFA